MLNRKKETKIKDRVIKGISVLMIREFAIKAISIGGQLLLVRILAPEFFGVYAIIVFLVSIVELFTQLGLSTAIIQKKTSLNDSQITSLVLIRVITGMIGIIVLFFLYPFLQRIYPQLSNVSGVLILVFSLTLLIKPVKNTIISLLERKLSYGQISKIDGIGMVTYYFVVIVFAYFQFGVVSFIVAVLVKEIVETLTAYYYHPIKIYAGFSYKQVKSLLHFGLLLQIGNFLSFINTSLIPIVGGQILPAQQLGYLVWSRNIASLPNAILDNYGRAAFSGIAKIQDNPELVSKAIDRSIAILNIFILFFIVMTLPYLNEFVEYILSDLWFPAVPSLAWFLLGSAFSGVIVPLGHGLLAIGKVKELTKLSLVITIIEVGLAFVLVYLFGFIGISVAYFMNAVMQFVGFSLLAKKSRIGLGFIPNFIKAILIVVLCFSIASILNMFLDVTLLNYILKLILTAILFWISCFIIFKKETIEILNLTKSVIKNE